MTVTYLWNKMAGISGFEPSSYQELMPNNDSLVIYLSRKQKIYRCSCGYKSDSYWDSDIHRVRDIGFCKWKMVYLIFKMVRIRCPFCGIKTERLQWLDKSNRYTTRLIDDIASAYSSIPTISIVSKQYDFPWHRVKAIGKTLPVIESDKLDDKRIQRISINAIQPNTNYNNGAIIMGYDLHNFIWVLRDNSKIELDRFYSLIGQDRCKHINSVTMNTWEPYIVSTRENCTNATILYK